jgi:NAD(P)-dependent dehydrogenase (short-subunit alcohol dehydrogenase family)
MAWSPDRDSLRGRVAVVAGATRGAGRGIAAELGEAGATVVCTGRSSSTGALRSGYNRSETIEEPIWEHDLDGSQPDVWRFIEEPRDRDLAANLDDDR